MKFLIFTMAVLLTFKAQAQTETLEKPLEFSGYFDMYYQTDANQQLRAPGRVFDARNNVAQVNLAELSFKKTKGPVQFRGDLAFGEMVDTLVGVDPTAAVSTANADPSKNITQAIVTYTPSAVNGLTIAAGKFYSYLGFEVTHAKDNWNYSRSYTYNYGIPFWHEGMSIGYAFIPGKLTGTVYVLNAWDGRIANEQNKSATLGASINWIPVESASLIYNYIGGAEGTDSGAVRTVHELNGSYAFNSLLSLAFDVISGQQTHVTTTTDAKWNAYTIYAKLSFTPWYNLSPRYEVFDDKDGFALGQGISQKITSVTLSNNFNLGDGLEARLEIRHDKSNVESTYFKNKDGQNSDSETTTTVALLYSF